MLTHKTHPIDLEIAMAITQAFVRIYPKCISLTAESRQKPLSSLDLLCQSGLQPPVRPDLLQFLADLSLTFVCAKAY